MIPWLIVAIVFGLIASAFFSGMETGLISLNRLRLRNEVERKDRRALIINRFVEDTEQLLGTTLTGTNLCNVLVAVASSALTIRFFGEGYLVDLSTTLVSAAIVLVLAEIVPKSLFRHFPHRLCLLFADVLNAAAWLLAPVVVALGFLMRFMSRLTGGGDEKPASFFVTREELKHLAKEGEAGGALTSEEREMIHGVFDFPHKTVHEVMMPLARTVTVTPDTGVAELFEISQRTGYARFPVREGEKITGIANVYEILFQNPSGTGVSPVSPAELNGRDARSTTAGPTVRDLMQKPQFVSATDRIHHVLPVLRASRTPISIVINPQGKPLGIITIEDIVEEIVGDVEG
jgi:CBS domain containing-hemolysin-like protein